MQLNIRHSKRRQNHSRKHPHSGVLTLDDLDRRLWKHTQLITRLQAKYKAEKELGKDKPSQKSEEISG